MKYFGYHFVMFASQHKCYVTGCRISQMGKRFGLYHKNFFTVAGFYRYTIFGKQIIFGSVFSQRKRFLILKRFCRHTFLCLNNLNVLRACLNFPIAKNLSVLWELFPCICMLRSSQCSLSGLKNVLKTIPKMSMQNFDRLLFFVFTKVHDLFITRKLLQDNFCI